MFSLKPPKTNYTSLTDIGKFNMIWNVSAVLVPIFVFLVVMHLIFGDATWTTSMAGLVLAVLNVILLKKTRKYEFVAMISVILGVVICMAVIFVVGSSRLLSDAMWCILVGFFTYFLFGSLWGTIVLLVNISALVINELIGGSFEQKVMGVSTMEINYKMAINVIYVGIALAYVIHKMLDNNNQVNALYEKEIARNEVLLKEIHHRVKNNLQIISSLLRLQSLEIENEALRQHFDEAVSRIRSMALIHEKLYQQGDLATLDVKAYLMTLANEVTASLKSDVDLEMEINSEVGQIDNKHIVPLALIFNELITNSIKHGFKDRKQAKIEIAITKVNEQIFFSYRDNGCWVEPAGDQSFGLDLLNTLTEQLGGKVTRKSNGGTLFEFEFNAKELLGEEHYSAAMNSKR